MSEICHTLLDQLERHNAKEELIVYPQADVVLTAAATDRLSSALASGCVPEAWVCEGAPAAGGPRAVEP